MDEPIEQTLLKRAQDGDYDAFDELHLLLEPVIGRFVRRLVGYGQEAEDIVQDTFLSLFTHLDRIEPAKNLRPYLFRIARNRSYDLLRRQGRFEKVSLDDEPIGVRVSFDLATQQDIPPEEVTHWILLNLEVQEAIDRLPERQRQTLILFAEENLTYAEIAEVIDVSIGTVKSRLFHAKKNLRGLLKPETLDLINEELIDTPRRPRETTVNSEDNEAEPDASSETAEPAMA